MLMTEKSKAKRRSFLVDRFKIDVGSMLQTCGELIGAATDKITKDVSK
jgi:hypothetical protein